MIRFLGFLGFWCFKATLRKEKIERISLAWEKSWPPSSRIRTSDLWIPAFVFIQLQSTALPTELSKARWGTRVRCGNIRWGEEKEQLGLNKMSETCSWSKVSDATAARARVKLLRKHEMLGNAAASPIRWITLTPQHLIQISDWSRYLSKVSQKSCW